MAEQQVPRVYIVPCDLSSIVLQVSDKGQEKSKAGPRDSTPPPSKKEKKNKNQNGGYFPQTYLFKTPHQGLAYLRWSGQGEKKKGQEVERRHDGNNNRGSAM